MSCSWPPKPNASLEMGGKPCIKLKLRMALSGHLATFSTDPNQEISFLYHLLFLSAKCPCSIVSVAAKPYQVSSGSCGFTSFTPI
jgi:hypothetical protein